MLSFGVMLISSNNNFFYEGNYEMITTNEFKRCLGLSYANITSKPTIA